MQADPAYLAIGTEVSAKYKGAFCEAKVRSVAKEVKCRVSFKFGLGSYTLSDEYVESEQPLTQGLVVKARHPEKQEYLEAHVSQIKDHSKYTVIFNDGDIATLRRTALCMRSGKHYNASESLDKLPLTHPEHFSNPVGKGRRRNRSGTGKDKDLSGDEDNDSAGCGGGGGGSDSEESSVSSAYMPHISGVVWAENTDKKTSKSKTEANGWFPALVVSPSACDTVQIDTKEDFLIRSFKDGRYYTVSKKDTTKFHKDSARKERGADSTHLKDAISKAVAYLERDELPAHWDRDVIFNTALSTENKNRSEEGETTSTTESSEESEDLDDELFEDESPESKDHLVAELYKHMEDRGSPINTAPAINGKELDLYKLYRIVDHYGGHSRVSNKNTWRTVAKKLGDKFDESTWTVNQVRVHYMRYLQSFEELNRTLGCAMTMVTSSRQRQRQQSGLSSNRLQMRGAGKHRQQKESEKLVKGSFQSLTPTEISHFNDKAQAAPQEETEEKEKEVETAKEAVKETPKQKKGKWSLAANAREKQKNDSKMTARPRRDSSTSLAAAMQVKAQKDNIGEMKGGGIRSGMSVRLDRDKEIESEVKKLRNKEEVVPKPTPKGPKKKEVTKSKEKEEKKEESGDEGKKEVKVKGPKQPMTPKKPKKKGLGVGIRDKGDFESRQHIAANVNVAIGDKIKVFYQRGGVYGAKVIKIKQPVEHEEKADEWPMFQVHYLGWNSRYDEWIPRSRIAEAPDSLVASAPATPAPEPKKGGSNASSRAGTPSRSGLTSRTSSPGLKRQGSRGSIKTSTATDSGDESSGSDLQQQSRKGSGLQVTQKKSPNRQLPESGRRSGRKRKEDNDEEKEVEVEKLDNETPTKKKAKKEPEIKSEEEGEKDAPARTSTRGKSVEKSTPKSKKGLKFDKENGPETDDPYAFKEPEPFDNSSPTKKEAKGKKESTPPPEPKAKEPKKGKDKMKKEPEEEKKVNTRKNSKKEEEKMDIKKEEEEEGEEDGDLKNVLNLTKKQQELFPHLATMAQKGPEVKNPPAVVPSSTSESDETATPVKKSSSEKYSKPKRKTPRKPNSSELVIESETSDEEGESEDPKEVLGAAVAAAVKTRNARKAQSTTPASTSPKQSTKPSSSNEEAAVSAAASAVAAKRRKRRNEATAESSEDAEDFPLTRKSEVKSVQKSSPVVKKAKKEDDETMDLACGETIPGSPVHEEPAKPLTDLSEIEDEEKSPEKSKVTKMKRSEMPFASVPESVDAPPAASQDVEESQGNKDDSSKSNILKLQSDDNAAFASEDLYMSSRSASQSPTSVGISRGATAIESDPKLSHLSAGSAGASGGGDSTSEIDMDDSLSGDHSRKADNVLDIENDSNASTGKRSNSSKRRYPAPGSPASAGKRRRRQRKTSTSTAAAGPRTSSRFAGQRRGYNHREDNDNDTDTEVLDNTDSELKRQDELKSLGSLDDEALNALSQRSPKSSRYNFYVELDPGMEPNERIAKLEASIDKLRITYTSVKNKLATIDRKRKKLLRRERDQGNTASDKSFVSSSSGNTVEALA